MTKRAFIFPGQGSQFIGMGKEAADQYAEAREVFEAVDDALGQKLSRIIFEGPIEELTLTSNTQPALMATSIALLKVIEKQTGKTLPELCNYVAGHSLGEYTALCAAGAIELGDTARLLRIRGDAMQAAVPAGQGGMAALIGVDFQQADEIAKEAAKGETCQAANDNGGGQVVVSGAVGAIERVLEVAAAKGVKRAVKLPVSAPFHSDLMKPAADKMRDALAAVTVNAPSVPLIANVTAEEVTDPQKIRDLLVEQVTGMVRWRESIEKLHALGVEELFEIGAGKVLSGLTRRIESSLKSTSLQTPENVDAAFAV